MLWKFRNGSQNVPSGFFIQGVSKGSLQTLRGVKAHHKDSELHRNPCPQTSS